MLASTAVRSPKVKSRPPFGHKCRQRWVGFSGSTATLLRTSDRAALFSRPFTTCFPISRTRVWLYLPTRIHTHARETPKLDNTTCVFEHRPTITTAVLVVWHGFSVFAPLRHTYLPRLGGMCSRARQLRLASRPRVLARGCAAENGHGMRLAFFLCLIFYFFRAKAGGDSSAHLSPTRCRRGIGGVTTPD